MTNFLIITAFILLLSTFILIALLVIKKKTDIKVEKKIKVVKYTTSFLALALLVFCIAYLAGSNKKVEVAEETTTEPVIVTEKSEVYDAMRIYMSNLGFEEGVDYVFDYDPRFNAELDNADAADGSFDTNGARSVEEQIAFLTSGSDKAEAQLKADSEKLGITREQYLDVLRWGSLQMLVDFSYTNNTGYVDGKIVETGERSGQKYEIINFFVSQNVTPEDPDSFSDDIKIVRGPCANPQEGTIIPQPKNPAEDVLANPLVAEWKKEDVANEPLKTVSTGDGSVVSNGIQTDPAADAVEVATEAATAAQVYAEQHQAAEAAATVVDTSQSHTAVTPPAW